MAPLTLRSILLKTELAHKQLAEYYGHLRKVSTREDSRVTLDHLHRREEKMVQALHDYREGTPADLLDRWFAVPPDVGVCPNTALIQFRPDMPPEDIVTMASMLNRCLLTTYRELVEEASTDELRDIARNLLEMEIREDVEMQSCEWQW